MADNAHAASEMAHQARLETKREGGSGVDTAAVITKSLAWSLKSVVYGTKPKVPSTWYPKLSHSLAVTVSR